MRPVCHAHPSHLASHHRVALAAFTRRDVFRSSPQPVFPFAQLGIRQIYSRSPEMFQTIFSVTGFCRSRRCDFYCKSSRHMKTERRWLDGIFECRSTVHAAANSAGLLDRRALLPALQLPE